MRLEFWMLLPIMLSAPAQLAFTIIYASPIFGAGQWWRDFVGRALFIKSLALAFTLTASTVTIFFRIFQNGVPVNYDFDLGALDIYQRVLFFGYWFMAIAIFYQLGAILKLRRDGHSLFKRVR